MSQYNPHPSHNPYVPGHAPMARRSAIPKVIGILMIIFGSIGVVGVLIGQVMPQDQHLMLSPEWQSAQKITSILGWIGLPLALLQLFAGITLVKYKRNGPTLALLYAALAAVNQIVNIIVTVTVVQPAMAKAFESMPGAGMMKGAVGFGVVLGAIFGFAWIIIIFALTQRQSAKSACVN